MSRCLVLPLLLLLTAAPASGHGLFFLTGAEADTLALGHDAVDEGGHGGLRRVPGAQVEKLLSVDRRGEVRTLRPDSAQAVVPADGMAALAVIDWGWWTKTLDGTVRGSADAVPGALQTWHSRDAIKRIRAWHPLLTRPLGDELQICPLEDPFAKRPGDKLRVCVWRDGAPVRGAVVAYGHDVRGATDADGCINIRLRRAGTQILRATVRTPLDGRVPTEAVRTTTLDFRLEAR